VTVAPGHLVGHLLDEKYRIVRLIGKGGMGAVYEAEHVGTGRTVAVKTILPALIEDAGALERFRREAKAAGRLRHPNIVDVTDFGIAHTAGGEVAYLAMEYLEGTTLRDLIRARGSLPLDLVVAIVEQIALALEAAHRGGIVHRDLKPDNVLLVPDPRGGYSVRVLDFGIAKLRDTSESVTVADFEPMIGAGDISIEETLARTDSPTLRIEPGTPAPGLLIDTDRLTIAGTTLGTPHYMSPEQCRGVTVDYRSDLYSLGVITYEALAGHRPFEATTLAALIKSHLHEDVPPLDRVATVPSRVATVVERALAKMPDERFSSATAFAGSLYAAAEGPRVILRRAAVLYIEHFASFFKISWQASRPGLALVAFFAALALVWPGAAVPLLMNGSILAWGLLTLMTNSAFAVVVDELRKRPLDEIDPERLSREVRRRLNAEEGQSPLGVFFKLFRIYLHAELKATAGAGDLAFLIAFLESRPVEEVPARCALLAQSSKRSYNWIRGAIFAALLLPPVVEACIIFSMVMLFGGANAPRAADIAVPGALLLVPINGLLLNPLFSSSLTLLYFRARQANGEDVALASVISGRL
jgi:serine/threonine protein kinase